MKKCHNLFLNFMNKAYFLNLKSFIVVVVVVFPMKYNPILVTIQL